MAEASRWVLLASYATGIEADIAVAALDAAGIPAHAHGNDLVGVFGPGFQGASARGVRVMVPDSALEDAWSVVIGR